MSDIRTITSSEISAYVAQLGIGFHFEVPNGLPEHILNTIDLERTWASFDGARVVGTLRSFATALTVPGPREVLASALTNVTVAPTHRRQGLLTAMIEADLRATVERSELVSILIASEYPIYGRFGYGPAVETARYVVDTRSTSFRHPASGSVEVVDRATLRREGPGLYDRVRAFTPGAIERPGHWWDRTLRQVEVPGDDPAKGQVALYRGPTGSLEGYVIYEGKSDWDGMRPQGTLALNELLSVTPEALHGLWSFCCGIDLLSTINAGLRPTDEVLPHLLHDGRAVKLESRADFVWVRVLDVCGALGARTYDRPGHLVLEVVDELGIANGRFALEGGPDGATCESTTAPADVSFRVDVLGSIFLGGVALRTFQLAGRADEHRPGAVAIADAMFRTARAPWCTTWF
jgi:predicted acetyltransferase